jgi:hypothetical protein
MVVDRKVFQTWFGKDSLPAWMCPTCNKGILEGVKGSFVRVETTSSKNAQGHPDWEPEWVSYEYSCRFICTNPKCGETVFNIGTGRLMEFVDFSDEGGYEASYADRFQPTFFSPALNIFNISPAAPRDVKDSIYKSFGLFFINPSASANQMRIALEQLLDHLAVKRFETEKGKRFSLSLHKRIGLIPNKVSHLKDLFLAVKWLGNDASHVSGVTQDELLNLYDIFESILNEIFGKTRDIKKLAQKINKGRGAS